VRLLTVLRAIPSCRPLLSQLGLKSKVLWFRWRDEALATALLDACSADSEANDKEEETDAAGAGASFRRFRFISGDGDEFSLSLELSSFCRAGLGWKVWPSAELLAQWLVGQVGAVRGLEVGAGPGLLGLVAARLGARRVVLTDSSKTVLDLLTANVARNGLEDCAVVHALDWEEEEVPGPAWEYGSFDFDVVLASDVLYGEGAAAALPLALHRALRGKSCGKFYGCFPSARGDRGLTIFLEHMLEMGFRCFLHKAADGDPTDQRCFFLFFELGSRGI